MHPQNYNLLEWCWSKEMAYSDNKQIVEGFITEKTFKAYYYELPILVVGLPRTYMHLRSLGYQTFPEFWDESFDTEEDDTIRLELIKRQIINYLEKPIEEIPKAP